MIEPDYGFKAYYSKNVFQRYWQRKKVSEVFKLIGFNSIVLDLGCGSAVISEKLSKEKNVMFF